MTKLSEIQHDLLAAAARHADGAADAIDHDRRTVASLIKRGCLIALPQAEGPTRLLITDAGRAAIMGEQEECASAAPPAPEPASPPPREAPVPTAKPKGKIGRVVELLSRPQGATITALMEATGWQAHSVRGAIAGAIKKGLGLTVISEATEAGRCYHIPPEAQGE